MRRIGLGVSDFAPAPGGALRPNALAAAAATATEKLVVHEFGGLLGAPPP
jgi:hypothetical protein